MEIRRGVKAGRERSLSIVPEGSVLNESIQKVEGVVLLLLSSQSLRSGPRRPVNFDVNLMTLCQQLTLEFNSEIASVGRGSSGPFCSRRNMLIEVS